MTERFLWFFIAFLIASLITGFIRRLAFRAGVVDYPATRKIHTKPMPLLGGAGIFFAVAACVLAILSVSGTLTSGSITPRQYLGFLVGGLVLVAGGALDDLFDLPPHMSMIPPVLAALVALVAGIEVSKLTNPFGGVIFLLHWQSNALVFLWLLVMMYTTKLLDGLDGLATGIASIGTVMILALSLTVAYFQTDIALLSSIILGSLFGFLLWNFHPAKIFLGEGGSTFVGYTLGILAVISGGKFATALLVVGIPLLDVAWIVFRRLRQGGMRRMIQSDRRHLHHRLADLGWSQRRIVLSYYAAAASFGLAALFLQSQQKLFALGILFLCMLGCIVWLIRYEQNHS